jgi:hypothetical protein
MGKIITLVCDCCGCKDAPELHKVNIPRDIFKGDLLGSRIMMNKNLKPFYVPATNEYPEVCGNCLKEIAFSTMQKFNQIKTKNNKDNDLQSSS